MFLRRLATPWKGSVSILWTGGPDRPLVKRVFIDGTGCSAREETCGKIEDLALRMTAFLSGGRTAIPLDLADMDSCGGFQRAVLLLEYTVPRGSITTYGRLARRLGSGARAVGNALARNPFPIMIPCHRALRADLSTGGYQGGTDMKRELLEMEGVVFDRPGRVSKNTCMWEFTQEREAK